MGIASGSVRVDMVATRVAQLNEALRAVSTRAEQLCGTIDAERLAAYAAAKQRGARGDEPYRMDFIGRLLNWTLEPGRFKFKTPGRFQPVNCGSAEQALAAFLASQDLVLSFIGEGAGMPLDDDI